MTTFRETVLNHRRKEASLPSSFDRSDDRYKNLLRHVSHMAFGYSMTPYHLAKKAFVNANEVSPSDFVLIAFQSNNQAVACFDGGHFRLIEKVRFHAKQFHLPVRYQFFRKSHACKKEFRPRLVPLVAAFCLGTHCIRGSTSLLRGIECQMWLTPHMLRVPYLGPGTKFF